MLKSAILSTQTTFRNLGTAPWTISFRIISLLTKINLMIVPRFAIIRPISTWSNKKLQKLTTALHATSQDYLLVTPSHHMRESTWRIKLTITISLRILKTFNLQTGTRWGLNHLQVMKARLDGESSLGQWISSSLTSRTHVCSSWWAWWRMLSTISTLTLLYQSQNQIITWIEHTKEAQSSMKSSGSI